MQRQGHEAGIWRNIWSSDSDLPLSSSWSHMQVLTQPWQQDTAQPLQCLLVLGISKGLARGLIPRQSSVHYQALRPAGRRSCKGSFPAIPSKERQSLLPLIASTGEAPLQLLPQNQMPKAAVGMSALQLYIWKLLPSCLVAAELLFLALGGGSTIPLRTHLLCPRLSLRKGILLWYQAEFWSCACLCHAPAQAPAGWPSLTPTICQDWLTSPAPPNWVQEDVAVGNVWGKAAALWNRRSHRQLSRSDKQELVMWDRSPSAQTA